MTQATDGAGPTEIAAFELRMLEPRKVTVFRALGVTRLTVADERSWTRVAVARAFPLSDPDHFLAFLDGAGKDIGLIREPGLLDADSRRVVDEELERRYFVPVVEKVLHVQEEYGTAYWTVQTTRGEKELVVRNIRDNIQEVGPSRVIITDIDGNRFEFPDVQKLDNKSLSIILRHL